MEHFQCVHIILTGKGNERNKDSEKSQNKSIGKWMATFDKQWNGLNVVP